MTGRPPWWFHDPELDPQDEEMANLLLDLREGRTLADLREAVESSSEKEEQEGEEDAPSFLEREQREQEDRPPTTQAPTVSTSTTTNAAIATPTQPASILPQGSHWKYRQPMPQPLGYLTAADANGGERTLTYLHPVDFDSRASVNKANKARAREVYRARKRFALPLSRESMVGHEFMPTHFDWIAIAHEAYAILHNGARIPWNILILWWNFCWHDTRSEQSLRALESRNQEFKDMRRGYRP